MKTLPIRPVLTLLLVTAVVGLAAQAPSTTRNRQAPQDTRATPSTTAPAKGDAPSGDAANGHKIFVRYGCYECHNYAANGGPAGARLAPNPIPYAQFSRYVRKPSGEMPPYTAKVVTDQELADIYAFLRSIGGSAR